MQKTKKIFEISTLYKYWYFVEIKFEISFCKTNQSSVKSKLFSGLFYRNSMGIFGSRENWMTTAAECINQNLDYNFISGVPVLYSFDMLVLFPGKNPAGAHRYY